MFSEHKAENFHPNPQIRRMREMEHPEPDGDEGMAKGPAKSYHVFHHEDGTAHSHIHHMDDTHEHTDHESHEEAHDHVGKACEAADMAQDTNDENAEDNV